MNTTTRRFISGIALLLIGLSLTITVNLTAPRIVRANGVANDDFDNAITINAVPYSNTQDVGSATTAADDPVFTCVSDQRYNTVWYRYTPVETGTLNVNTFGSTYDTVLAVWTGARGSLTSRACNDDSGGRQSRVVLTVNAGTTYYIEIASYYSITSGSLMLSVSFTPPTVRYAAPTAQGSGDCSSWANACTLQTALTNAVIGDEIWVKAGVHYPGAAGNRTATFTLKNGVALYGGFAGTEASRDERNWQNNKTILSGDIDRNDINADGNFIAETWNDIVGNNAYHVVTADRVGDTAILDGFVITAGQANGSVPHDRGGGMDNNNDPTLNNIIFSGNYAISYGGGMNSEDTASMYPDPTLTNVTFSGNSAGYSGGGMENFYGNPTLTNITFSGNSAPRGGGMYNSGIYGGGNATLTNVAFYSNTATDGGGMYNSLSYPELTNILFYNNSAINGGGIYNRGSTSLLTNVTFFGNRATNSGGGIYNRQHEYYYVDSETTIANSIVWDNGSPAIYNDSTSVISATYSLVEGGWPGEGNLDADPLFVDAAAGNLRLQAGSPAIDAGNNAAVPPGVTTDLDGNPRIDYIVDMGAYEYQAGPGPRPFGKTSPLNGNTSQPLTLTLSWNASLLANAYAYCYDTTNNDACDSTWITISQTSAQISGLSQGATYYWQVRAVNNDGTTYANRGEWWSFTTAPSRPGFFNKTSPPSGTVRAPVITTLSWTASPGVGQYEYCYDTTNDNACSTWRSAGTDTSVTLLDLLQDTTYYWQVRAVNAYGMTYANRSSTDFWSFTTFHLPGAFNKISPADGSDRVNVSTLSWGASSDADVYEYCYDTTNDNACSTWLSAGTAISVTIPDLFPNTSYYWQVRARNDGGVTYADGSSTNFWSFKTSLPPGAFNKISPANRSDQNNRVTLSWNASSDAVAYEYCYDTTNDNACSTWLSAGTAISVTLPNLPQNTAYYWQVRAVNAYGTTYADGSSTNFWSFTTSLPTAFNKTSPADGSDQQNTVTLRWSASSGADAYEFCFDTTNDNACLEWLLAGTDTSVTLFNLIPGATYYWQVRARNNQGITYADGSSAAFWSFRTNLVGWTGSGGRVSFLTDLERTQWRSFRLTFSGVGNCIAQAPWGLVIVFNEPYEGTAQAAGPGTIANNRFSHSSSNFSFAGQFSSALTATGTYSLTGYTVIKIVVIQGVPCPCQFLVTQSGSWSANRSLLRPSAFGKTTPTNGAVNQNTILALWWNPSIDAAEYQYCLDTTDNNVCDTTWVSTGVQLSADLSGLAQDTTYYWQVRATNAQGATDADNGVWWWFRTMDTISPTVLSITRADANPTNAASVRFLVAFSEAVQNVDAGDFDLTATGGLSGASVTSVSGSGAVYTVTVSTGSGSGTLRLDVPTSATIADLAGNPLTGLPYTGGEVYTVDKTAPTVVSITRVDPSPTNAASVRFAVTFSEAVAGVDVDDFSLTTTGISGASVTGVSGSGAVYTVTVSTGSGSGTLRLDIPTSATIADLAGNLLTGLPYTGGEVYTVDKTAPTVVSSTRADASPTNAAGVRFIVAFSEAVQNVDAGDFDLTATGGLSGASVTGVSGSGAAYTVTVSTGSGSGTLRLDVPTSATITNLTGNPLIGLPYTGGEAYTIDKQAPAVLSITRVDPSPTNATGVRFFVTFSEAVAGVDVDDFSLTTTGISGASVTGVSGSGAVYTVTVSTGSGSGTLRLNIPNTASITDLVGNPLTGLPYTGGEAYGVCKGTPSFTSAPVTAAAPGRLYTYAVTATDPDLAYGDALTITAPTLPAWLTLQDHGNGTATLSGTPDTLGDYDIVLRVTDRFGASAEQSFTITVRERRYIFLPLVIRNAP